MTSYVSIYFPPIGLESGADSSDDMGDAARMVILHLSVEEILRVACGTIDKATGKNLGLEAVNQVNRISLVQDPCCF